MDTEIPKRSAAETREPTLSDNQGGQLRRPRATSPQKHPLTLGCIPALILFMVDTIALKPLDPKTLRSGALAKAASVSPDTIRHYEKLGILPPAHRTAGGYRVYPASAVQRVLVVQRALRIGFTLAELAEVLQARDAGAAPCGRVFELAQQKLTAIATRIDDLKRTERALKKVLAEWQARMQSAAPGEKSHLLYSLTEALQNSGAPVNQFRRKNKS